MDILSIRKGGFLMNTLSKIAYLHSDQSVTTANNFNDGYHTYMRKQSEKYKRNFENEYIKAYMKLLSNYHR